MASASITPEQNRIGLWRYSKRLAISSLDLIAPKTCYRLRNEWRLRNKLFAEPEIYLVPRFCDRNGTAVDVGAAFGEYAFVMCKHSNSVHAFEPNTLCSRYLEARMPDNVRVHELALSDRTGLSQLRVPSKSHGLATIEVGNSLAGVEGTVDTQTVRTEPLDALGLEEVKFIKIDVEGHELAVLRGAMETIKRCNPVLQVEIEERHAANSLQRAPDLLRILGYEGFFFNDGQLKPFRELLPERDQGLSRATDGTMGQRYINNFIFLKEPHLRELADTAILAG